MTADEFLDTIHAIGADCNIDRPSIGAEVSTPLSRGSLTRIRPRHSITPTIADCRYRVPLTPRLHVS